MKRFILFIIAFNISGAFSQLSSSQIDSITQLTLKTFDVPGIAVAVIKDGKVIHSKGYGVRSLLNNKPVDANTLFGIASNSKAFTATALAMMVDEGKLKWDDKVTDYIPEFKLYDPFVTNSFTIRDLLSHRSGLGLGAGDLMFFPDDNTFTKKEIIHNLRYLKPVSEFRSKYDYNNNLFIVAGEVLERVSGLSWEEFIETKIMNPLGFQNSKASWERAKNNLNIIDAHVPFNGKVQAIPHDWSNNANAAGGILSNLNDLSKWVIMQLDSGRYNINKNLFSLKVQNDMWAPQTIIPVRGKNYYHTQFSAYGLGWRLSDVKGFKEVGHTGGLLGTVTQVTLIPELKLGIIVLTNQQSGAAFSAITNSIKDAYLGLSGKKWVSDYADIISRNDKRSDSIENAVWKIVDSSASKKSINDNFKNIYSGAYKDDWFGKATVFQESGKLRFVSEKSSKLKGELLYYKGNTFIVKWDNRSLDADAYVVFSLNKEGKAVEFVMEAISPKTDFSFDFQDLNFKLIE
ncbi:MAG: serine hydrolase [Ferruginibacter sp.]